jgi:putative membrane protein
MRSLFTPDELRRIHDAIASIKRTTAMDIDVVVTPVSDRYSLYPLMWAALGALMLTGFATLLWPRVGGRASMLIQISVLLVLFVLFDWLPVRLRIVPMQVKRSHARQLAHREFAAHVAAGANRNRILLFVSIGERYVEIIADHKTHGLVPQGTWDKIVGDFVTTVKSGRVADGLFDAIEACRAVVSTSVNNEVGPRNGE